LHRVLFYRELGFGLEAIAALLGDESDALSHLRRQRELLAQRIGRLEQMAAAVDRELEAHEMGDSLTPEERFALFGDGFDDSYAAEAEQRWGDTEAWRQSHRRTASYTATDWRAIKAESAAVEQDFARALATGEQADGGPAMDLAERHRQHLVRWFYDCPPTMHRGLGRMYVADERFRAYYENVAPGLAAFLSCAIEANADRQDRSA
jgi:MerR family transcriptional regulator, thiopeptide resistance regulator